MAKEGAALDGAVTVVRPARCVALGGVAEAGPHRRPRVHVGPPYGRLGAVGAVALPPHAPVPQVLRLVRPVAVESHDVLVTRGVLTPSKGQRTPMDVVGGQARPSRPDGEPGPLTASLCPSFESPAEGA